MLNELSQVVESLERLGLATESRHPRISPMGKNKDLLVICLAPDGKPSRVEIMEGDSAANLFRVEHGSAGSSFPGFNVPTPLRCLREAPTERLMPAVEHLLTLNKNKNAVITDFAAAIAELFSLSTPRGFTDSQEKQFQRCCFELVSGLRETLGKSPAELKNFLNLLAIVAAKKPTDEDWKKANAKSKKAKEATPEGEKKGTMKEKNLSEYRDRAFHDALCQNYFDVRYFGQVVSTEGPLKGSFYGQIRGPLQITFAESLDKILQLDFSITRCAVANETEAEKKGDDNRTMGRKHTVPVRSLPLPHSLLAGLRCENALHICGP